MNDRSVSQTTSHPSHGTAATTRSVVNTIAWVLLIVGGLNWALVGLFNFDLVATIFGPMTTPSRIVYVLVGLAALYGLSLLPRLSRRHGTDVHA